MRGILTYHSIDSSGSAISIPEQQFVRHVEWMASGEVRVVSVSDLQKSTAQDHSVAMTFDDGFTNFRDKAWPVLRDHGFPVTLFVVTDKTGGFNEWSGSQGLAIPTLSLLDWDSLGRLAEEGVDIGSHTKTHPDLRTLDPAAVEDELVGAAERIKMETGREAKLFAYPYGFVNRRVAETARRVYSLACTADLRSLRRVEDEIRLPRLDAYYFRDPGRLEAWGSIGFRIHLAARAAGRRARRMLKVLGSRVTAPRG